MKHLNFESIALTIGIAVIALMFTACAPHGHDTAESSSPAPSMPVPVAYNDSGSGTLCDDTLIWSEGFTFKVNTADLSVALLPFGEYGHASYINGWGASIDACHYAVVQGVAPYMLKEQTN